MRGAWVEMCCRGCVVLLIKSLPVRGAWVEIAVRRWKMIRERGLKLDEPAQQVHQARGRSPCGERGLKFGSPLPQCSGSPSLPVRGAWVEIICRMLERILSASLPVQGAWVEISRMQAHHRPACRSPCRERGLKCRIYPLPVCVKSSLPVQGAWVEMHSQKMRFRKFGVAPHAGSVG